MGLKTSNQSEVGAYIDSIANRRNIADLKATA